MTPPAATASHSPEAPDAASLSQADLTQLFTAFNEVTGRLQETHERLTGEVGRLQGELRRANDELERSRRLAALGEMAAGIAHEIRNPLGSIGLYAEMLAADLPGSAEHELASKIVRAVQGLDAVVSDVLTFSREMRTCPVEQGSREAFEHAASACCDVLARCDVRIEGDEPVSADPNLLQQALVNLLRNAADAVERRGAIVLNACRVLMPEGEPAVALAVRDTGPGVPDDVRERMFNPFFTTRAAGTGLGLAIVHRIVDAHAGLVRVSNREPSGMDPGGATVEIILPTPTPGRAAADPRSAA